MKNKDPRASECKIFMCDKMRGAYCCRKCKYMSKCRNPCLNHPGKCGQYQGETENRD